MLSKGASMGFQDYISEREAASRAGVSPRTLQRFAEAGYLHVEIEPDGLRLYPRSEIEEIFGMHQGAPAPSVSTAGSEQSTEPPRYEEPLSEKPLPEEPRVTETESFTSEPASMAQPEKARETAPQGEATQPETVLPTSPDNSDGRGSVDAEIVRLRNLIKAQEKILDMKEAEIRDLRGQRDWLQTRVERLEEKSERDQILLLSETQTIRRLISIQEHKRSAVRQFLEWLGLAPLKPVQVLPPGKAIVSESQSPSSSIEVGKAANG
jgi:hypothetical protein